MSDVVLPLAEIKKRLSEIVDGVEERHDRVVLTRRGRPVAVIMSPEELESLEETLDILSDPNAIRGLREAEAAIEAGDTIDAATLRANYLDAVTRWELVVAAPAARSLDRLRAGVAAAVVEFMLGPLTEQPTVVGKPLQRELSGYWSARRGAYRIVYRIEEREHRVVVVRIDHRSQVYRRR